MERGVSVASRRYRILFAITLGYGLAYPCRLAIGVVKKPLIDQGILTPSQLGTIGSALFASYALGKLLNGFLADHVDVRLFVAAGFGISALCCAGMGISTGVVVGALLWGLNGWFQSFGAPGCVVALTSAFPGAQRGRAYGIWSISHSIGEGLTFLLVAAAVSAFGWRWGYWSAAIMGVAATLLALTLLGRIERPHADAAARPSRAEVLKTQIAVLRIPAIWLLGLSSALVYVTRYAINSWGVLYLQEAQGLSLSSAATLILVSNLAGIAGAIGFGFLSDVAFGGRRPPANLAFAFVEISGLLLIFYGPGTIVTLAGGLILFGLGMTGLVTSIGGLFATDMAPKRVAGAALGVIGIFSYLGSAVQEQISGWLIERGHTLSHGVHHYDFTAAILFWIGASVVSMLLAAALWKTGGHAEQ